MISIPNIEYAIIGGSSTFSLDFPEIFQSEKLKIIEKNITFRTPFGTSPSFKIFSLYNKKIITCKMHGWRSGTTRGTASQQIFWVFKEAGVKTIFTEGGVGSINTNLNPRDIVIPHDYIDFSERRTTSLTDDYLLIMRDPFCSILRDTLINAVKYFLPERNLSTACIYCNTDGRHFESRAEVKMIENWGASVIGQSICPEVYLAREIDACYAGIYMVVNYAEGIIKDWEYKELKDIFLNEGKNIAIIILKAIENLFSLKRTCKCNELRRITLLK
ncbi:MAG: MTAP family purine nucleoside phosphorylase [Candidatus Firestonebacteria bacterium]|nr:MTAP family purine nucleoside phosphorylase [Candidatus Firestonebacteria bacterium]